MPDYKPIIVSDVERSIGAVNDIVVTLQRDGNALSSDIIQVNYSAATVDEFFRFSKLVVDGLQSAASTTANWLSESGTKISENIDEARCVEEALRKATLEQRKAEEHTKATEDRIRVLESDIQSGEENLVSAQRSLDSAKDELDTQETIRNVMRVGAFALFFFAPIFTVALTAIDATALQHAVEAQENTIRTIEGQLSTSRSQLQSQRDTLSQERAEIKRLSEKKTELSQRAAGLAGEARELESARSTLVDLSVRINDCLHTVNSALSSSKTISTMSSMRNVVSGIRGVVVALGANDMFAGSLAQLNDNALGSLDRRVAAIRRHQLTV